VTWVWGQGRSCDVRTSKRTDKAYVIGKDGWTCMNEVGVGCVEWQQPGKKGKEDRSELRRGWKEGGPNQGWSCPYIIPQMTLTSLDELPFELHHCQFPELSICNDNQQITRRVTWNSRIGFAGPSVCTWVVLCRSVKGNKLE
jgi:hypothetical protein